MTLLSNVRFFYHFLYRVKIHIEHTSYKIFYILIAFMTHQYGILTQLHCYYRTFQFLCFITHVVLSCKYKSWFLNGKVVYSAWLTYMIQMMIINNDVKKYLEIIYIALHSYFKTKQQLYMNWCMLFFQYCTKKKLFPDYDMYGPWKCQQYSV